MKLNQNVLSPYNNFNKVDATTVVCKDADDTMQTAEYLLDYYLRNSSMPTGDDIDNKLRYLDRKIEATRKTISSWESYRISAVATGEEELRQKLGSLQPNTGLVVNSLESASVTVNNQSYARGDIIFKDINNQQHHIASYSGGYYYPAAIKPVENEDDNNAVEDDTESTSSSLDINTVTPTGSYILSYVYATSAPASLEEESPIPTLGESLLTTPSEKIQINFTPASESGAYGCREAVSRNQNMQTEVTIFDEMQPIVAWYLITNSSTGRGERVYFDEEYTISDDKIQCSNDTSFESLWVEVR